MQKTPKAKNINSNKTQMLPMFPEEHRDLLSEVSGFIASLGRLDAAQALACVRNLCRVKAVLPEKSYGKWVKLECGMTVRNAWNYTICVEVLSEAQQELLVAAGAKLTVMSTIATAKEPMITELVGRIAAGEHLTVARIKQLIKGDAPKKAQGEGGGAAGLRRAVDARVKVDLEVINKLVKRSLKAVELIVADINKGKHVPKTRLATAVEADCQKAGTLLSAVISPRGSDAPLPAEWEHARRTIARLGESSRYPGREEFIDWVVEQVLPALRFVVLGDASANTGKANDEPEADSLDADTDAAEMHADHEAADGKGAPSVEEADEVGMAKASPQVSTRPRLADVPPMVPDDVSTTEPEAQEEGAAVND